MNNAPIASVDDGLTRREGLFILLGSALALTGCGGGGGSVAGVSSGGTGSVSGGSLSSGTITGFGSIILNSNGVRIDDSSASIRDDDGNDMRGKLRLGMQAMVTASAVSASSASASAIVVGGELLGRIEGTPNAAQRTFVVLGQTVRVTGSTMLDATLVNGFNDLRTDTVVEVHGLLDPVANTLTATFIEKKNSPALFKIQGIASNHDAIARKFNIGAVRISYSATTDVRITPVNGTLVRVRMTAVLPPAALPVEWGATRIRPPENIVENREEVEIEGNITAFTSPAQFRVNGVPVSTSSSTRFDDGTAVLAVGVRVEVRGRLSSGVLIAERVRLRDNDEVDNLEFELHGAVANVTPTTFEVRGMKVNYFATTEFRDGTRSNLINGAQVEVRGVAADSSSSSTGIDATRISFE
ncbi:MAG TPA: DUF5666 domain-containing protein [Ramlibacter sp.]|nr:DUF5666 domain-containing protein [Ramlibacter sp.]